MTELIEQLRSPVAEAGTGFVTLGMPVSRVDGRAKVTGQARYAAEHAENDLAYGVVISSKATRGTIVNIDARQALQVAGVLDVITHRNRPKMRDIGLFYKDMRRPAARHFDRCMMIRCSTADSRSHWWWPRRSRRHVTLHR